VQGPGIVDVIAAEAGGGWVVESVTGHWSWLTGRVSTLHMLLLALFTPPPHYVSSDERNCALAACQGLAAMYY